MDKLISVVVPVYNVENYLSICIESIIYQDYKNIEIILVDDGSTDSSGKICEKYKLLDNRIRVIHQQNGGLSNARNVGIKIAKGEYIGFVDSDDWIAKKMYSTLISLCEEKETDIAVCERILVESDFIDDNGTSGEVYIASTDEALDVLYKDEKYYSHAWNKLYKRELFDNIQFPNGKTFEDIYIMHDIFSLSKRVAFIDKGLYYYRSRYNSIARVNDYKMWKSYFEALVKRGESPCTKGREKYLYKNLIGVAEHLKSVDKPADYSSKDINIQLLHFFSFRYGAKICIRTFLVCYVAFILRIIRKVKRNDKLKNLIKRVVKRLKAKRIVISHNHVNIILMGTPEYNNLGDLAIAYSIKKFITSRFPECNFIEIPENLLRLGVFPQNINNKDLLLLTGGGNFGDIYMDQQIIRKRVLKKYSSNHIISMPQTVQFSNTDFGENERRVIYSLLEKCRNVCVFAREKYSFQYFKDFFPTTCVELCPDMVLSNLFANVEDRKDILVLLRRDIESILTPTERETIISSLYKLQEEIVISDTCLPYSVPLENRDVEVEKFITNLSTYKVVITDRLHGIIFCAITGTPCVAIGNFNHKIVGILEWLKQLNYIEFIVNTCDINIKVEKLLQKYPNGSDKRINQTLFNPLYNVIKKKLEII